MNQRKVGAVYEKLASEYIETQGYRVLLRNYRCPYGEIDLVARDGEYLVFLEVKYRRNLRDGSALEAVNMRKQRIIGRVARYYLMEYPQWADFPCRFDVVGITEDRVDLVRNAFDYI